MSGFAGSRSRVRCKVRCTNTRIVFIGTKVAALHAAKDELRVVATWVPSPSAIPTDDYDHSYYACPDRAEWKPSFEPRDVGA